MEIVGLMWGEVQVKAYEAVLSPGDSLFFPPRWAHHTESLDQSISITYRFGPRKRATLRLGRILQPWRGCLGGCYRHLVAG